VPYFMCVLRIVVELLVEVAQGVPDGVVAFFPSYGYLESILVFWEERGE
jgi:Rad3-related DNA helicase